MGYKTHRCATVGTSGGTDDKAVHVIMWLYEVATYSFTQTKHTTIIINSDMPKILSKTLGLKGSVSAGFEYWFKRPLFKSKYLKCFSIRH